MLLISNVFLFSESVGYPTTETNRMWYPTVEDIRNMIAKKGLEADRLETIVETLREDGDMVHYEYTPDPVSFHSNI